MEKKQINRARINALKEILLRLHNGEPFDAVQEEFNEHFKNVSALEISLMQNELVEGGHGVQFEDVIDMCNVHADLLGNTIDVVDSPHSTHPGHPVQVFKNENAALQATLDRIDPIIIELEKDTSLLKEQRMINRLKTELTLLGDFFVHYDRKEKLFFPIMEKHGHHTPPKVMWGVDDEIRDLYKIVRKLVNELPALAFADFLTSYRAFEHEFKEMIYKEETIFLPMVLSFFTEDDWKSIAKDSDAIGYAIIQPEEKWASALEVDSRPTTEKTTLEQLADDIAQLSKEITVLANKINT